MFTFDVERKNIAADYSDKVKLVQFVIVADYCNKMKMAQVVIAADYCDKLKMAQFVIAVEMLTVQYMVYYLAEIIEELNYLKMIRQNFRKQLKGQI